MLRNKTYKIERIIFKYVGFKGKMGEIFTVILNIFQYILFYIFLETLEIIQRHHVEGETIGENHTAISFEGRDPTHSMWAD